MDFHMYRTESHQFNLNQNDEAQVLKSNDKNSLIVTLN